jgi:hypothetical protein
MACKSLTATPCKCTLPTELRIFAPETLKGSRVPPLVEELLEDELLELEELEELLEDDELDEELLEDELDELELLELEELDELLLDELELLDEPEIAPADTVSVTRSSLAPSSLRSIRKV